VLYARGLTTADIFRVSYCDFDADTMPECLRAPAPTPGAASRSNATNSTGGGGEAPKAQAAPEYRGAFVAVVVTCVVATFVILLVLVAIALVEGAAAGARHVALRLKRVQMSEACLTLHRSPSAVCRFAGGAGAGFEFSLIAYEHISADVHRKCVLLARPRYACASRRIADTPASLAAGGRSSRCCGWRLRRRRAPFCAASTWRCVAATCWPSSGPAAAARHVRRVFALASTLADASMRRARC
jgi:hypothetical protein